MSYYVHAHCAEKTLCIARAPNTLNTVQSSLRTVQSLLHWKGRKRDGAPLIRD